jgi:hypothetical protein
MTGRRSAAVGRGWTVALLALISLGAALTPAPLPSDLLAADPPRSVPPTPLVYVETATGLEPPTLEGGRTEIGIGDVDGDGHLDLVSVGDHGSPLVGTDQHGIMVWLGDGAGRFTLEMTGDFGYGGVALGDVDGDGLLDVAYGIHHGWASSDLGDQLLEVALGDGSGAGWTAWDDGLAANGETWGMFSTDLADIDGDGDLDLGSVGFGCCAGVHVYRNLGDGSWQQTFGRLGGNSGMHLVFGDIDGDGDADLAVSHAAATVYLGDGAGGYSQNDGGLPPGGSRGRLGVSLGDVDADGADDLAFCNPAGGVEVWELDATGGWHDRSGTLPDLGECEATQLADMDVDGRVDLVVFGAGEGAVWSGDGGGGWVQIGAFSTPPVGTMQALRAGADLDHNGYPDIVLIAEEGAWPSLRNRLHILTEPSTATGLSIAPVRPRGGEALRAGGVVFVDWLAAVPGGEPAIVDLELSTAGPGGPWRPIATHLPNNGRHQWTVPADTPATSNAFIRLRAEAGGDAAVVTTAAFTITGGPPDPSRAPRRVDPDHRRVPTPP